MHGLSVCQCYDYVEIFCGKGWVKRVMGSAGQRTASFDILLGDPEPGKQDVMDLTTPSGFWTLGCMVGCVCMCLCVC